MKVKETIRYIIFKQILIRIYNFITLKMIYPLTYRKNAKRPVKKGKVILLEPRFPETTDSLLRINAELERRGGFEIKEMSLGLEMLRIKQQYRKIMAFLKEFADAEYVFTTRPSAASISVRRRRSYRCGMRAAHSSALDSVLPNRNSGRANSSRICILCTTTMTL